MARSRFPGWLWDRPAIRAVMITLLLPLALALALIHWPGHGQGFENGQAWRPVSSTDSHEDVAVRPSLWLAAPGYTKRVAAVQTPAGTTPVGRTAWQAEASSSSASSSASNVKASSAPAVSSDASSAGDDDAGRVVDIAPPAIPTVHAGSPLGSPVVDADLQLTGDRALTWQEDGRQWILLEHQASFSLGTYGFRADRMVVRIEHEQQLGRRVRHVWIVLDQARPMLGRGPLQGQAGRLLVTLATTGGLDLLTNLMTPTPPATDDPFVTYARGRFTRYAWGASQATLPVPEGQPLVDDSALAMRDRRRAELAALSQRYRAELPAQRLAELEQQETRSVTPRPRTRVEPDPDQAQAEADKPSRDRRGMILPADGAVLFQYDRVAVQPVGEDELALVFMGNVSVMYEKGQGDQGMVLTASNAVVFVRRPEGLGGQLPDTRAADAQDVRGIYLEDNVQATNGQFTVRAPRVFYDLSRNKAVVLDAVMYTYDVRRRLPIYVRAQKLRQESLHAWSAEHASLTTTEFAEPSLSIGARQITFAQETGPDGQLRQPFVAQGANVRVAGAPVFAWPRLSGDASTFIPLRRADAGYRSEDGPFLQTRWDLFALMGRTAPQGVDMTASLDYMGRRGPGFGLNLEYDLPHMFGEFDGYLMPLDHGTDRIGGRDDVDHDGDLRGYYSWRHRQIIQGGWELSLQSAAVTDETFLEEFFPDQADLTRPWETSVYLKKQQDDWAFTFLGSYDINEFAPQTTTLQSPGYRVDRLPELGYHRIGTSLWDNRLTYFSETTFSRMRFRFGDDRPSRRGFTNAQSLLNFGLPSDMAYGDAFRAAGLDTDWRSRLDSRHEIQAPMKWGIIDAVPFLVGRVTAYDDDFEDYGGDGDNVRGMATAGLRLHTQFQRTFDNVENRFFNLHRLRHLIEPFADLSYTGSTHDPENIPVYDARVEGVQEGAAFRLGMRNTLQTQRGGPGRWRNVDWLVLNTYFVLRSDDANPSMIPAYYAYRPELGTGRDHFHADVMWMISDTLAAVGQVVYDFDNNRTAHWHVGLTMQHSPVLESFLEYSEIDALDSRLLGVGFNYQLTRKWSTGVRYTFDLAGEKSREIDVMLVRDLSDWRMVINISHDAVDDRQTFSVVLLPNFVSSHRKANLFRPALAY